MGDAFKEREQAFEGKFKHDQEFEFKVNSRRDKLFGLWLAEKFGITGKEAEDYAMTMVMADMEEPGHEDVVRAALKDVATRKADISEAEIRVAMEETLEEARKQLMAK